MTSPDPAVLEIVKNTLLITYEEALAMVIEASHPLESEALPLARCSGRVLAFDLICPMDLPRFDNSAVDGYAICQPDLEALNATQEIELQIARTIAAGDEPGQPLKSGETVRIFTGAKTPENVAAIVMQEDVHERPAAFDKSVRPSANGPKVSIRAPIKPGQHIRRKGEEFRSGERGLPKSAPLNPAGIAFAATLGYAELPVHRLPRTAIVTTGAELVAPGQALDASQIYESNSFGLAAALNAIGMSPVHLQTVGDDAAQTLSAVRSALEVCDVLITTGGVSVGAFDVVKDAFAECGVEKVFWSVAIKPGRPIYFGLRVSSSGARQAVFGLPGNPLSVLATFHMFARPYILASAGHANPEPRRLKAILTGSVQHKVGRKEFVPAILENDSGDFTVHPVTGQGSHMLGGLAISNSLIEVPSGISEYQCGESVWVVAYEQVAP